MRFLITPNSNFTDRAIVTDEYSDSEVANGLHLKHIRADLEHSNFRTPVRVYTLVGDKVPTKYFLLS